VEGLRGEEEGRGGEEKMMKRGTGKRRRREVEGRKEGREGRRGSTVKPPSKNSVHFKVKLETNR